MCGVVQWHVALHEIRAPTGPCTNRPMQCVLCRDAVWVYGMAHHFDSKHPGSAPPSALCAKAKEKEILVNCSGKKNNSKWSHHEMDAEDGGDVAKGPPRASTAPAPHPMRIKSSGSFSSFSSSPPPPKHLRGRAFSPVAECREEEPGV